MTPKHLDQINAALEHHRAGRLGQAEAIYRSVLALDPQNFNALHLLGIAHQQRGDNAAARQLIERAIATQPRVAEMHHSLGNTLMAIGDFAGARENFALAAQFKPQYADAHFGLGSALQGLGDHPVAIAAFREAIRLNPQFAAAFNNLANSLAAIGKADEALALVRRAVEVQPQGAQAWTTLGNLLSGLKQFTEAEAAFSRAITLDPSCVPAYNNLSIALLELGRLSESEAAAEKAIALQPDFADAHNNLGRTRLVQGRVEPAIEALRAALRARPSFHFAHSNMLVALHYVDAYSPQEIFEEHLRFAKQHSRPALPPVPRAPRAGRRLRIGYLSPNFGQHVIGFFIEPLFAHHDRTQFEIFCYSDVANPDAMTAHLQSLVEHWHNAAAMPDAQLAQLIRDDRIDILIDLAGHTASNRMPMLSQKPAPIQATYLGYPDTTGIASMDFRITDALADPIGTTESLHVEKLIRLPCAWCYRPIENTPPPDRAPRENDRIRFASFNNLAKITPRMIEVWSKILHYVPDSRLLLKARGLHDVGVQQRLRDAFAAHGVADQLELHPPTPNLIEHLAVYQRVDIALDTFPYHGTTTTCEAMWMGVPVVTLAGHTHVSRVGVSLLTNVGLPQLIVDSPDNYVEIAANLRPGERLLLRERLRQSPLMDGESFARNFEKALGEMAARS